METEIRKANHYVSFYNTAKRIKDNEARLAFYDALDAYRFEGIMPDFDNMPILAAVAFEACLPNIDADISRKCGGAPKKNQNAKKQKADFIEQEETEQDCDYGYSDDVESDTEEFSENQNDTENNLYIEENNVKTTTEKNKNNLKQVHCFFENNLTSEVVLEKTNNVNDNVKVNVNVKEKEKAKEKEKSPGGRAFSKNFIKPTVSQIQEYCNERQNSINAQNFFDFYESKGWKIGHDSMKDWKACIRTWENRANSTRASPGKSYTNSPTLPQDRLTF